MSINQKQLGQRIREYRLDRRLTQEALAFHASVSVPHISCIENGVRKVGIDVLIKLANAFQVDVTTLLFGNTFRGKDEALSELIHLFDDCNISERRVLIAAAVGAVKALKDTLRE